VTGGFDVFGQRYATVLDPLIAPDPPYVWTLSDSQIKVSWPTLAGFDMANYEVYADGATTPTQVTTNHWWTQTGLAPLSTHTYRLAYVLSDGRRSPLSPPAQATTYDVYPPGGMPAEWLKAYWGPYYWNWPPPTADTDGDGASNGNEFLAGTNPTDPNSVLRTALTPSLQGFYLHWNTEPGRIYQVQRSTDLAQWVEVGGPRFAAGPVDSVYVGGLNAGMFRVVLLRN
jgi:hypothetical protein